jgi:putative membrane protein
MTTRAMLKKARLSEASLENISAAVKDAESRTTGEIALALAAESASYSFWELLFAAIAGVFVFFVMIPFAPAIGNFLDSLFWTASTWQLPAFYGISCFGIVALLFGAANIPAIDRIVVPRRVRSRAVAHRAQRHFLQSGVCNTKDRSGVLIFLSYLEREVRIVADIGISEKISDDLWTIIAEDLAAGIGKEDAEAAFVRAVERCGELLAQHFPARDGDADELDNRLAILEDDE